MTKILDKVRIGFVYLTEADVVRHPLVQRIIEAYDLYEKKKKREQRVNTWMGETKLERIL